MSVKKRNAINFPFCFSFFSCIIFLFISFFHLKNIIIFLFNRLAHALLFANEMRSVSSDVRRCSCHISDRVIRMVLYGRTTCNRIAVERRAGSFVGRRRADGGTLHGGGRF